ncbi:P2Y purinoceptor 14-like isoform X1 [Gambusia affinis]|uniref:P2Y purinoceptor 14-like isoform X1 n=2 Tax=Gambusia affinis TaxID=33528 RepID=UPI001CDB9756|nr:P2Y purinoceptor 14-like isoform X1 [Gambusia affinis]
MSVPESVTPAVSNASVPNQSMTNPGPCNPGERSTHLIFILVYSVLFLVGLVFNSFTLWFHCCQPQRNGSKSLMIYLKNLTAADFLLCLSLPLRIIHYATRSVTIHLLYCSFGASILFLNMYSSILFMGYIALNRYFKVVRPFGAFFLLTKRAACITSLTTWVFLLTPMTAYSTMLLKTLKPDMSGEESCEDLHSDSTKLIYRTLHIGASTIFLLVFFSMVFSYYSASRRVLQAQQRQSASCSSRMLQRSRRKMLVLICIFCICFVPYHLIRLLFTFLQQRSSDRVFYYLMEFATIVSILNVCLDPLVYFVFCKGFRFHLRHKSFSSQKEKEARRSNEEQLRSIDLNKDKTLSTTSRSTSEV